MILLTRNGLNLNITSHFFDQTFKNLYGSIDLYYYEYKHEDCDHDKNRDSPTPQRFDEVKCDTKYYCDFCNYVDGFNDCLRKTLHDICAIIGQWEYYNMTEFIYHDNHTKYCIIH